jgi:hypothetical protein
VLGSSRMASPLVENASTLSYQQELGCFAIGLGVQERFEHLKM